VEAIERDFYLHEHALSRQGGIDNHVFATLQRRHMHRPGRQLFGEQWGDIWLETTHTSCKEQQSNEEAGYCSVWVFDDTRDSADNDDDMSEHCNADSDIDRLEPSPLCVCEVACNERDKVGPETVEKTSAGRCTLSVVQSTRLAIRTRIVARGRAVRKRFWNKVSPAKRSVTITEGRNGRGSTNAE